VSSFEQLPTQLIWLWIHRSRGLSTKISDRRPLGPSCYYMAYLQLEYKVFKSSKQYEQNKSKDKALLCGFYVFHRFLIGFHQRSDNMAGHSRQTKYIKQNKFE